MEDNNNFQNTSENPLDSKEASKTPSDSSTGECSNDYDSDASSFFDPFQIFEVSAQKCHIVHVQILHGQDKPKGWVFSLFHTPDLYILLHVPNTPNGYKRTKTITNCLSPVWNETFTFLLDPNEPYFLEMFLMDANSLRNDTKVDEVKIDLNEMTMDEEVDKEINFPKGPTAWIKLLRMEDTKSDLRFSLALSPEEKEFLKKRREKIFEGMKKFLGSEYGPNEIGESTVYPLLSHDHADSICTREFIIKCAQGYIMEQS